jgi:hypothetical protein
MTTVSLRIVGHPAPDAAQSKLRMSMLEGKDIVIPSRLGSEASLNDHLVWLWGILKHERRTLKRVAADGAKLVCLAKVSGGPITVKPNGAELLHLLEAELRIERT